MAVGLGLGLCGGFEVHVATTYLLTCCLRYLILCMENVVEGVGFCNVGWSVVCDRLLATENRPRKNLVLNSMVSKLVYAFGVRK